MKEHLNVWIYCRVDDCRELELLDFQADWLTDYARQHGYRILGLTKVVDKANDLHSMALKPVISAVVDEFIDAILVYSQKRLLVDESLYEKLELICLMHNVSIITYKK